MIEGVIFDLDGVIVSTDVFHYQAWKKIADKEGVYFDEKKNDLLRGVSRLESLEIILNDSKKTYSEFQKDDLLKEKNDYYLSLLEDLSSKDILPGVLELLDYLEKKGIKTAIGSSSKNAKYILKKIGLDKRFNAIADGNDVKRSKPFPDIFLAAARKLNLNADVCLVIEDAEAGLIAAREAKMQFYAVGNACESSIANNKSRNILDVIAQITEL